MPRSDSRAVSRVPCLRVSAFFVGHGLLGVHRLLGMLQAQGQDHLVLPQGQGVDQGGLDPFHQEGVVVLQKADLRGHLEGDLARQLQVVQLLFKAVALGGKILGLLGIHRIAAGFGDFLQLRQVGFPDFPQPFFTGRDVHGQLMEIIQVHVVHAVEHGHVLEQLHLVLLQAGGDLFDIDGHVVVFGLHGGQMGLGVVEQPAESGGLFGGGFKALQLADQLGQHIAHVAGVVRFDVGQDAVGEGGDLLRV